MYVCHICHNYGYVHYLATIKLISFIFCTRIDHYPEGDQWTITFLNLLTDNAPGRRKALNQCRFNSPEANTIGGDVMMVT